MAGIDPAIQQVIGTFACSCGWPHMSSDLIRGSSAAMTMSGGGSPSSPPETPSKALASVLRRSRLALRFSLAWRKHQRRTLRKKSEPLVLHSARRWNSHPAVTSAAYHSGTLRPGGQHDRGALSVLMITVFCAYLACKVAVRPDRALKAWYWMGALFGPFVLIAVYLLPRSDNKAVP